MESVFFITTFEKYPIWLNEYGVYVCNKRTVGFVSSAEEARDIVENNKFDLFEYLYEYAVIEEIYAGIYPQLDNRETTFELYKFDQKDEAYKKIDNPPFMEKNKTDKRFFFVEIG